VNIFGIKNHLSTWRDWELNPIVVKELRQAVRSWAVTGMLLLFLVVLFAASLSFLAMGGDDLETALGSQMFSAFTVILAIASVLFIPLYMGIRVASERQENNPDLFYISTLTPARIIRGKFLCGVYMAVLFFSACMPFMAFTNLLRGVDLPTIFFILFCLFLVVCAANMIAIFLGCVSASRPLKILIAIAGVIASFWLVVPLLGYSFFFLNSGIATSMGGSRFWITAFTAVAVGVAVTGLFFFLAVGMVSPPSANRALPIRIYMTAIWLLTGMLGLGWMAKSGSSDAINVWAGLMLALLISSLLVVIANTDQLSQRVRRAIPRSFVKRVFAFLFFNGPGGGLIWVGLLMCATGTAAARLGALSPGHITRAGDWLVYGTVAAYAVSYSLTALFFHRKFLPARSPKLTPLIAAFVCGVFSLLPSVILFLLNKLSWASIERLELGNVFNLFSMRDDSRLIDHFYFAFGWFVLMMMANGPWLARQWQNFAPLKDAPPIIP
jgi:hypothetical protein